MTTPHTPSTPSAERAEFEAWALSRACPPKALESRQDGTYSETGVVAAMWAAWQAAKGWRPIETAKDGPLYMVGWIDPDDGFDRHDIDRLEDGVWQQHADNVEHFRSCAQAGAHGPKEHPPYTHCMGIQPIPPRQAQGGDAAAEIGRGMP